MDNRFTFHYVSISTLAPMTEIATWFLFTFHYVSISTFSCALSAFAFLIIYIPLCIYFNFLASIALAFAMFIYIPLCIYFNRYYRAYIGCLRVHLHSTMYLFQPASGCRIVFRHFGFTFHYVSISTCFPAYSASLFKIYIPLCIYFN